MYNRDVDIDASAVEKLPQLPTLNHLDNVPTLDEVEVAVQKLRSDAAANSSGLSQAALKALPTVGLELLHKCMVKFWKGVLVPQSWHKNVLRLLYQGKGDKNDLNNYRGLRLQDTVAKMASSLATARLYVLLQHHGLATQFGAQANMGCRDALFSLRSILQSRKTHEQESWVLFIDLIKAFDTARHDLLDRSSLASERRRR